MRPRRNLLLPACLAATSMVLLAGCGAAAGGPGQPVVVKAAEPAAAPQAAASAATPPCKDGKSSVASLAPGNITSDWQTAADSPTMKRIHKNGHLTAGTSGDVLLWGATNPGNGELEGFDIELLKEIASYAGVPGKIDFHVINYGERLTALKAQTVDIVAHTMTINCNRWEGTDPAPNAINFSSEYYLAGQKILVRSDSKVTAIQQLKGQKVCVPSASTNLANIQGMGLDIVQQDVIGNCLVMFQEGEVVAITGDDTVLAGFQAQDPFAHLAGNAFSKEPYGLGINAADPVFTRWVNAVLEKLRTNGRLAQIYGETMGKLKNAPPYDMPQATYGRDIAGLKRASS